MTVVLDQGVLLDSGCGSGWSLMRMVLGHGGPQGSCFGPSLSG